MLSMALLDLILSFSSFLPFKQRGSEHSHQIMQMVPSFAFKAWSPILCQAPAYQLAQMAVALIHAYCFLCFGIEIKRKDR